VILLSVERLGNWYVQYIYVIFAGSRGKDVNAKLMYEGRYIGTVYM